MAGIPIGAALDPEVGAAVDSDVGAAVEVDVGADVGAVVGSDVGRAVCATAAAGDKTGPCVQCCPVAAPVHALSIIAAAARATALPRLGLRGDTGTSPSGSRELGAHGRAIVSRGNDQHCHLSAFLLVPNRMQVDIGT